MNSLKFKWGNNLPKDWICCPGGWLDGAVVIPDAGAVGSPLLGCEAGNVCGSGLYITAPPGSAAIKGGKLGNTITQNLWQS